MKILMANATHRWGGVKSWTLAVGQGLVSRGHAVTVVLRPGDPFGEAAAAAGLTVRRLAYGPDFNPLAIAWFAGRFGRSRPDLIVTNVGKDNRTAAVAARLADVPVVHRVGGPGDLTDRGVIRWTHRHLVTRILVPSHSTRAALLAHAWIDPEQVTVIPNGVDLERFRPGMAPGLLRSEIAARPRDFLIATTGQLTRVKGHVHLVEAVATLISRDIPARLVLIGTGPERGALGRLAAARGIEDRVHFAGFRRDPAALLDDVDVAVQPSLMEGLPHSVIEFMAMARPIVASRLPGIREAVEDGVSGLLVTPERPEELAAALERLWKSPETRASLGAAARARAEAEFGLATMIARVESFLVSVAREPAPETPHA